MSGKPFLDTTVLIYSISAGDPRRDDCGEAAGCRWLYQRAGVERIRRRCSSQTEYVLVSK